jgi:hypothetical protein
MFRKTCFLISIVVGSGCAMNDIAPEHLERNRQVAQGTAVYEARLEDFASAMGGGSDWGAAFRSFLTTSSAQTLRLACNTTYSVQTTVDICRQVVIQGCGPTTIVQATPGVTPFRVRYAGAACSPPTATGADTRFEDMTLREAAAASVVRFGVWAEATVHLQDIAIAGFSNGVRIDADMTRTGTALSQANSWSMNRVTVTNADHAGVLTFGRDANAGLAERVTARNNCAQTSKVGSSGPLYPVYGSSPVFPPCGGIVDASLGGSVWSAIWTNGTTSPFPGARFEGFDQNANGSIGAEDDSGHAVCLGCRKDEATSSVLSTNAIGMGNRSAYSGTGVSLTATRVMTNVTLRGAVFGPVDPAGTDATDALMFITLADGTVMHWEQSGTSDLRGSWKGANSLVGWNWYASPQSFVGTP